LTSRGPISFWHYNLILEVAALLFGALILTAALLVAFAEFDRYYLERQSEDAGRVSAFLQTHLDDAGETLARFMELPSDEQSETVAELLTAFSDIYAVDADLRVQRIFKTTPSSQVFEGFSLQTGRLAGYLRKGTGQGELSNMMRGLEDSRASVYLSMNHGDNHYLARLDLNYLQEFVTRYGNISRTPLLLVTPDGFVMLSSHTELRIPEIRPADWNSPPVSGRSIYIDGQRWIPLISEPTSTGMHVVTLIPTELLEAQRQAMLMALAIALTAIAILFLAKNVRVRQSLIKPLTALTRRIQAIEQGSFTTPETAPIPKGVQPDERSLKTVRFRELEDIESRFAAMARAIRDREDSLFAVSAQAQAASEAKSVFLANMSHELRTPLNAVLGLTQFLQQSDLNPDDREILNRIHEAGDSLLHIINDVLDLSKIEAGEIHLDPHPFVLDEVLHRVHRLFAVQASNKGLAIVLAPSPQAVPPLFGDVQRLQQILMNLVGNAVKFTERGQISMAVAIMDGLDSGEQDVVPSASSPHIDTANRIGLEISVRDTGIGIQPEHQAELFDPFYQVENAMTRRFGGTGLGLSISRRLAELMGGNIKVESTPGQGSEFRVCIPFPLASEPCQMLENPASPSDTRTERLSGLRLLLADDSSTNQFLLEKMLQREGAEVISVGNGLEAVECLRTDPTSISGVLMDLQMPVMDGITAIRMIREELQQTDLPIIAVTAGIRGPQHDSAREAGADAILIKPLNLDEAIAFIQTICVARVPDRIRAPAPKPSVETQVGPQVEVEREWVAAGNPEAPEMAVMDFPMIDGINREEAIQLTQGNARLFLRLLELFRNEFAGVIPSVQRAMQGGDLESAVLRLQHLRGGAAQIAASTLANLAQHLEQAIRAGHTDIDEAVDVLGGALEALLRDIGNKA
jgi:signal transduction histidine kinase/CheY-like chemotaxis protein